MEVLTGAVPKAWRRLPLGDVCDVQIGPSGSLYRSTDNITVGHRMITPKDVRENGIVVGGASVIEFGTATGAERYRLRAGDIVCLRIGRSRRHALVGREHEGWLFDSGLLRLRPRAQLVPRYLDHYLRQPGVQAWLTSHTSGTAVPTLGTSNLRDLPLLLPPRAIQNEIVDILTAFDKKVAAHLEISRVTARLRDTLAPALLTGRLSPPRTEASS